MELDEAIKKRQSIRSYKRKKVNWRDVLEAIDAANQAPFAGNQNHLKYIITEDKTKIQKIARHANQIWINEATLVIIVCSNDSYLEHHYGERGRIYGKQQAGAAIQNLLLKLTDIGLSACWIGAFTDELIKHSLYIPAHIQIEAVIPVGYSNERIGRKKKKELEQVIYWEQWDKDKKPSIVAEQQTGPTR